MNNLTLVKIFGYTLQNRYRINFFYHYKNKLNFVTLKITALCVYDLNTNIKAASRISFYISSPL